MAPTSKPARALLCAMVATAIAAPGAAAQDLRSPDARDAADAAKARLVGSMYRDLRSADAKDAATPTRQAAPISLPAADTSSASGGGFDVGSGLIGAAGAAGVLVLMLGAATRVRRTRLSA
jgi:hypothetical protein